MRITKTIKTLLILTLVSFTVFACVPELTPKQKTEKERRAAIFLAQKQVRLKLKNPSSAVFPSSGSYSEVDVKDSVKILASYYDAKNDYGSLKRGFYNVHYIVKKGNVRVLNVEFRP